MGHRKPFFQHHPRLPTSTQWGSTSDTGVTTAYAPPTTEESVKMIIDTFDNLRPFITKSLKTMDENFLHFYKEFDHFEKQLDDIHHHLDRIPARVQDHLTQVTLRLREEQEKQGEEQKVAIEAIQQELEELRKDREEMQRKLEKQEVDLRLAQLRAISVEKEREDAEYEDMFQRTRKNLEEEAQAIPTTSPVPNSKMETVAYTLHVTSSTQDRHPKFSRNEIRKAFMALRTRLIKFSTSSALHLGALNAMDLESQANDMFCPPAIWNSLTTNQRAYRVMAAVFKGLFRHILRPGVSSLDVKEKDTTSAQPSKPVRRAANEIWAALKPLIRFIFASNQRQVFREIVSICQEAVQLKIHLEQHQGYKIEVPRGVADWGEHGWDQVIKCLKAMEWLQIRGMEGDKRASREWVAVPFGALTMTVDGKKFVMEKCWVVAGPTSHKVNSKARARSDGSKAVRMKRRSVVEDTVSETVDTGTIVGNSIPGSFPVDSDFKTEEKVDKPGERPRRKRENSPRVVTKTQRERIRRLFVESDSE
ncbi:hypothetical protein QBC35DRAFT_478724 [Podospora australis]|uniref:Uncharacterized protein n=1 Tax=Podospora australis TaxID=1536484 RepID=A0AAN6WM50_9PEZI|nr:hypothetical protein QBC35DRAFT_478724 [Podospora australis]